MPYNRLFRALPAVAALLAGFACARPSTSAGVPWSAATAAAAATTTGSWIDLSSPSEWRGYRRTDLPAGWSFDANRVLTHTRNGGDIVTTRQFASFELEVEWKVTPKGNSGIFYWATESTDRIYENAQEMQVLDNSGHADGRSALTSAGANYALYAPPSDVTRPVGEWNAARLVIRGEHAEHWLNGVKVVDYVVGSPDWVARERASKFRDWPSFGLARRGHIGLQDHGDLVAFRNMRIREIAP